MSVMKERFDPIVARHSTWVAVNPIQGCPNNCRYCFMKKLMLTKVKPQVLVPHNQVMDLITTNKYYTDTVPICYFSSTDIMSTTENIEYLLDLLNDLINSNIMNPVILVTKCYIPQNVIDMLVKVQNTGRKVIIYISYSGLDNSIEKGIDANNAIINFKNLHENNIVTIHYYRPLIPMNSTLEIIDYIIGYVSKYACTSVVTGLKIFKECQNMYDFWEEATSIDNAYEYECIWPAGVRERLKTVAKKYNYSIYQTNSCALEYALHGYDKYGFYQTSRCTEFNMCSTEMRSNCQNNCKTKSEKVISEFFTSIGYCDMEFKVEDTDYICTATNSIIKIYVLLAVN